MRDLSSAALLAISIILMVPPSGRAAQPAPEVPDLETKIVHENRIEATPPPAHHFNAEAPASAKAGPQGKPAAEKLEVTLAPKKLEVALTASREPRDVALEVFVCDDAKTYCKKKRQTVHVGPVTTAAHPKSSAGSLPRPPHVLKADSARFDRETDFIVDDPDKAFALAKKKKLPLMIDFFGIWCPPCNSLDAMVFKSDEFRAKTSKRFVKLKVDTDRDRFNALKAHYRIQGLPTVIFATSSGDEIVRVLGFQPLDEMLAKSDMAYRNRDEGYGEISKQAREGNLDARYKAARIALDRDEPAQALEWLEPLKALLHGAPAPSGVTGTKHDPRLADLYRAELGVAEVTSDKKAARDTLEQWLKDFPEGVPAMENWRKLSEMQAEDGDKDASRASLLKAVEIAGRLLKTGPEAFKGTDYTPGEMWEEYADMIAETGDAAKAKSAYLACADSFIAEAKAEKSPFPRGPNLERGYCLGKAGETAKGEALYREGIRRYPREYTFHQGLAKFWLELKEPKKALPEAKQAVKHSYGNQRYKSLMTLARAYESLGEPQKAIDAIDAELKTAAPADAAPSTIKLRESLAKKRDALKAAATKPATG
jgi:thiol-disulfide isomerase/thioredoxin